ncbi:antibiotic biosynthesis monooxygenase [Pseudomonas fuscovaginae UPB0736]|uniref:Antibiotic biosynthesis monooxygenase n=1 Tax=Pseudomonas asplenii TaxID=53407 RepID=A0A1H6NYN2_9PSED|nr:MULTISPECIES: antibiotic biosynthesis monooxygenase [Pseudomonas]UUQ65786.1 antibiotic biosynthesis monooxygenase [Pseudomonas fuscovaginae UPB0736]UZE30986.1 antibiotic biosynthesis monooxygenase [Pseudomonas asplenii]SDT38034.1 Antibiotic biosynthesis monooxygenase [Pseudomonas asplenii]SEI16247.1 Antibiotic biosynthesis monooxygenase [Pseudomonas fuscovaginae]
MPSTEKNRSFTQLIQFEIEPRQQDALVNALARQTERLAEGFVGFISGNVQASDDGRRVLNVLQWQSKQAGEAAFARFESGEEDFWRLIRSHQAKAVTFGSFQVLRSIERSHDDALHCALISQIG